MSDASPNPYQTPVSSASKPISASQGELATLGERFLGALIDGLIMVPLAGGAGFALGLTLLASGMEPGIGFTLVSSILGGLIGAGIYLAVNGYLLATKGQSVGKLVMKTRIVSENTNQILPFQELVLKRYVPFWVAGAVPYIGALVGLVDALLIFRNTRKCLHDDIANTKVIKIAN